jgi:hypothetical protein
MPSISRLQLGLGALLARAPKPDDGAGLFSPTSDVLIWSGESLAPAFPLMAELPLFFFHPRQHPLRHSERSRPVVSLPLGSRRGPACEVEESLFAFPWAPSLLSKLSSLCIGGRTLVPLFPPLVSSFPLPALSL